MHPAGVHLVDTRAHSKGHLTYWILLKIYLTSIYVLQHFSGTTNTICLTLKGSYPYTKSLYVLHEQITIIIIFETSDNNNLVIYRRRTLIMCGLVVRDFFFFAGALYCLSHNLLCATCTQKHAFLMVKTDADYIQIVILVKWLRLRGDIVRYCVVFSVLLG